MGVLRVLLIVLGTLVLCACTGNRGPVDTPECLSYRHMLTAPQSPDAAERLRVKCLMSGERNHSPGMPGTEK